MMALHGPAAFWVCGLLLCLFIGPVQSSARTTMLRMSVEGKEGAAFGLYTTTGRAATFLAPILLRTDDAFAAPVHRVEAFGPVSTLLPYDNLDGLTDAVALGEGSLAGSIVTGDDDFAREVITRLAPWHGRLLVLNRDDAAESTGHGVAMPQMLHGGPGRAGGGEELGGLRAVHHLLQRTAVQGHANLLATLVPAADQEG